MYSSKGPRPKIFFFLRNLNNSFPLSFALSSASSLLCLLSSVFSPRNAVKFLVSASSDEAPSSRQTSPSNTLASSLLSATLRTNSSYFSAFIFSLYFFPSFPSASLPNIDQNTKPPNHQTPKPPNCQIIKPLNLLPNPATVLRATRR